MHSQSYRLPIGRDGLKQCMLILPAVGFTASFPSSQGHGNRAGFRLCLRNRWEACYSISAPGPTHCSRSLRMSTQDSAFLSVHYTHPLAWIGGDWKPTGGRYSVCSKNKTQAFLAACGSVGNPVAVYLQGWGFDSCASALCVWVGGGVLHVHIMFSTGYSGSLLNSPIRQ